MHPLGVIRTVPVQFLNRTDWGGIIEDSLSWLSTV